MVSINALGFLMATLLVAFVTVDAKKTEATACEGQTLNIRCPFGLINIISANFGRSSKTVCPANNDDAIKFVGCRSENSLSIVKSRCSDRKSCSVDANNAVFGDPCPGTFKYLQVEYECVTPWDPRQTKKVVACEYTELKVACGDGQKILVLGANYGRTNKETCATGNFNNNNCILPKSINVVTQKCGGKQQCTVSASNDVFTDPCVGINKYLEVEYFCCKA